MSEWPNVESRGIHVSILLDASGSMWGSEKQVIYGLNKYLDKLRESLDDYTITIVAFDGNNYKMRYKIIYGGVPLSQVIPITNKQYTPGGGTPLYDAFGRLTTETSTFKTNSNPSRCLVIVMADGGENESIGIDESGVKQLIKGLESPQFGFMFLAVQHGAWYQGERMGFSPDSVLKTNGPNGVDNAIIKMTEGTINYAMTGSTAIATLEG